MMAARAGAAEVVGVDVDPIVNLAKEIAATNGFSESQLRFVHGDSRALELDGYFDLIVTECMGNFFVSDEMARVVMDAGRLLKPGGRFLPTAIELHLAPVFCPQLNEVDFWRQSHYGFEFEPAVTLALNRSYVIHVAEELLLSAPACFERIEFNAMKQDLHGSVSFTIERNLTAHGVCGWFSAQLCDGELLTTRPGADTTHWGQTIFPLMPLSLKQGDQMDFSLNISHDGDSVGRIQWEGAVTRGGNQTYRFDHDTHRARL
jgi:hypothetical protein